jgi:hypothetical protein
MRTIILKSIAEVKKCLYNGRFVYLTVAVKESGQWDTSKRPSDANFHTSKRIVVTLVGSDVNGFQIFDSKADEPHAVLPYDQFECGLFTCTLN